ncbi:MAG: hypothetical protein HY396_02730 [Candidatus Doudnabacteria bacterium]|nr:hypothetical protein [Candidatus Doudnabacteria bacterium]
MRIPEQPIPQPGERPNKQPENEQGKRARLILRYIDKTFGRWEILAPTAQEQKELEAEKRSMEEYYAKRSPREKVDVLYSKLMAYAVDRQADVARKQEAQQRNEKYKPRKADPYLFSEIKILSSDPKVRELLPATYGEARFDAKKFRISALGNLWQNINEEMHQKEDAYRLLEQDVHLSRIAGAGAVSAARSRMARLAENISTLGWRKQGLETLWGFPKTTENTDAVANFQYENLKEYKKQLDTGFVWLPSRKEIHKKTVSAILNHRWPVLIGEAGSGKSDQADAAALELTGHLPTEVECESTTGETQLIKDKVIASQSEGGESYEEYGPLMRAFTGYDDSRQEKPEIATGRIARFDESGRLGPKAYSIIKKARQRKSGDDFYGHSVLPGASAIWTSNPVGPRYPDRHAPDPAMRRELAEIYVDYPEMSKENPELYEFALAALEDENYHIVVAKEELAPTYERKDILENQREVLEDGSIVVAKDEIVENMADSRHGALWRFTAAIKALQDSFVFGNAETEKYPDTLLRFKEDADGNIEVMASGSGEPLTLSTSTVTLGELASWMRGFNERREKQDAEFRVGTLTEWLNFKINTYLEQADKADKEKLRAIFRHFGFLDKSVVPDLKKAQPLTPKEIGYLSPRVPRPVHVERPVGEETTKAKSERPEAQEVKEYETRQVLLENGGRVNIKVGAHAFEWDNVKFGSNIRRSGVKFSFVGVIEDETSVSNGKPVAQLAGGEKLYKIFTPEELHVGLLVEFAAVSEEELHDLEKDIAESCAIGE